MGYSVLIVDDEPVICRGLLQLISWEKYGFTRCDTCCSGGEALAMTRGRRYSAILTDIRMGDMSGLELIRQLHAGQACQNLVIISSFAEFEYAQTALRYGVREYLLKPVSRHKLGACIAAIAEELSAAPSAEAEEAAARISEGMGVRKTELVDALTEYVKKHFAENLSLSMLGEVFHMNKAYLGQVFQEGVGTTFSQYLNNYRVRRAVELLDKEPMVIGRLCEAVGFNDMANFYRCFKRHTGMTPMEYRKRMCR